MKVCRNPYVHAGSVHSQFPLVHKENYIFQCGEKSERSQVLKAKTKEKLISNFSLINSYKCRRTIVKCCLYISIFSSGGEPMNHAK